tara:strand:- start:438 stop:1907 length:1470 start_codon:yes stop_codon:yes gene_type:complete
MVCLVCVLSCAAIIVAAAAEAPTVLTPLELARVWMHAGGSHELCPIAVAVALRDSGTSRPASPFGLDCDRRRSSRRGRDTLGLWSVHSTTLDETCALDCDCSTKYAVTALSKDWTHDDRDVNLALRTSDIVTANGACSGWRFVSSWNEGKAMLRGMWGGVSILFALLSRVASLFWWCIRGLGYMLFGILYLAWVVFRWVFRMSGSAMRWSVGALWTTVRRICSNIKLIATILCMGAVPWITVTLWKRRQLVRDTFWLRWCSRRTKASAGVQQRGARIATSTSLEWKDEYGNWNLLDQASMRKVNAAAALGLSTVSITPPNNQTYDLNFNTTRMTQTNRKYKTVKQLRWVASSSSAGRGVGAAPRTPTSSAAAAARDESPPPTVYGIEAKQLAAWAPFRQAIDAQAASPNMYYRCEPKDADPQIRALYTYASNQFRKTCRSRSWQIIAVDLCIHPIKVRAHACTETASFVSFRTPLMCTLSHHMPHTPSL